MKFRLCQIESPSCRFDIMISDCIKNREFVNDDTVLTAVPIHDIRDREYNQSEVIARVVCEELGMVYADKEQVVIYEDKEAEYFRQYDDIPNE